MRFDNVTIKDIAKELNLSTSTVSRALRDSYEISYRTKKIVTEYAEKINYNRNPAALSLKEKRSRSIGVVVSEIANTFFSEAINGIESVAYDQAYYVIITQSHESEEREKINVLHHASRSVDGLLISLSSGTIDLSYLQVLFDKGLPIVFFDRITDEIKTHKVTANNYLGAFQAVEHLINQGFKKIAHITSAPYLSITKERLQGYKDALEQNDIPFDGALLKNCNHGGMISSEVEDAIAELFKEKTKPDAIFTASDRITEVCFAALKQMEKHSDAYSGHIGFAGFSNTKSGELFDPPMTVVQQPAFEIGKAATELLIKMIESKRQITNFETKIIDTKLIIRESSLKNDDSGHLQKTN